MKASHGQRTWLPPKRIYFGLVFIFIFNSFKKHLASLLLQITWGGRILTLHGHQVRVLCVCLFVCCHETRKSFLRLPSLEGSNTPDSMSTDLDHVTTPESRWCFGHQFSWILLWTSTIPPISGHKTKQHSGQATWSGFFVCFFVVMKPENPYFASRPGIEVNPPGVYP